MRRFTHLLFFLLLVDEGVSTNFYHQYMFAPFAWVHAVLFTPVASVRPFDLIMLLLLVLARTRGPKSATVRPMRNTLLVAAAVTAASVAHGLASGGDGRAAGWQTYLLFSTILTAFALAAVFRTAEQFAKLARTVVSAGLYHAVMGVIFYLFYVKAGRVSPLPPYLTTHDDTVLWTVGVGFLFLRAMQTPTFKVRALASLGMLLLVVAIQLNHRRLAWISLGGAFLTLYVLIPPNVIKRRIRRVVLYVGPVLALYVLIGMGRPEGIFRPLQAFESVSSAEDNSTKARNVENLGLIATGRQGWLLGTGWGHRYVEVSNKYQIYFFELWPFVPHNSVLGLFAYTGYLGFIGYWMMFPMAAYFHARTARLAAGSAERFVGVVGVIEIVACGNQWYGDMGSFSAITSYTLATCLAAALRVPIQAGVWSDKRTPPPAPRAAEVPAAPPVAQETI